MDGAQWPQHQQVDVFSRPMEDIPIPLPNNTNNNNNNPTNINNNNSRASTQVIVGDQRTTTRPLKDQIVNCPRCHSTNTKFCYYNNYSLTQPRYFCKACRRYWTQGGSLRNVPVGGGSRKNKRSSPSISSNPSSTSISAVGHPTKIIPDLNPPNSLSHLINSSHQNPKFLQGQDLNLAFPIQGIFQQPNNNNNENNEPINIMNVNNGGNNNISTSSNTTNTCNTTTSNTPISALELLRTGIASRGSLNPYVPMPIMPDSNTLYPSGFPNLQDFKPNMNIFSHPGDHNNNMVGSGDNNNVRGGGGRGGGGSGGARLLFPFADMNKLASTTPTSGGTTEIDNDQSRGGNHHQGPTPGYWSSGMLGGGTW